MSKYGCYDEVTGELRGWYDDEVHEVIPEPNAELTIEEWQAAVDNGYNYYDGSVWSLKDFRDNDELISNCLHLLKTMHDDIVVSSAGSMADEIKRNARYNATLRRETKGQADPSDIKILNDNDVIDSWHDDMETAMEGINYGEQWIEDPARTSQELIDYDPTLVPWPEYPII